MITECPARYPSLSGEHDGIEVVGEAANGIRAVEQINELHPTSFFSMCDAYLMFWSYENVEHDGPSRIYLRHGRCAQPFGFDGSTFSMTQNIQIRHQHIEKNDVGMKFIDLLHRTYSFAARLQLQCRRVRPDSDGYRAGDRFIIDDEDSVFMRIRSGMVMMAHSLDRRPR